MDIPGLAGRYHSSMPQPPLPFPSFTGKKVAFKTLGSFDLSRSSDSESFHRSSSALYFWHLSLLSNRQQALAFGSFYYLLPHALRLLPSLFWRQQHRHVPSLQPGGDIELGNIQHLG